MRRPRASRSTCSRSRRPRSGSTSTSSRRRSTNTTLFCRPIPKQPWKDRLGNPVWHIHDGNPPAIDLPVPFCDAAQSCQRIERAEQRRSVGLHFPLCAGRDAGNASASRPACRLCDPLFPRFREDRKILSCAGCGRARRAGKAVGAAGALPTDADGEAIQNAALNVARKIERYQDHTKQSPEGGPGVSVAFFQMIYQVLIGQERGPRFGSFAGALRHRGDAGIDCEGAPGSCLIERMVRIAAGYPSPLLWEKESRCSEGFAAAGRKCPSPRMRLFRRRHRGRSRPRAPSRSTQAIRRRSACRYGSARRLPSPLLRPAIRSTFSLARMWHSAAHWRPRLVSISGRQSRR